MASNCDEAVCYQPTLQDVDDLVNGWEQFLEGSAVEFDKQAFQKLVERLPQSTFHSKLKQITHNFDNLTGFVFDALRRFKDSEQGQQPEGEREDFTRPTIFKNVDLKLEELTDLPLLSVYKDKEFTNFPDLADNIQRKIWDLIKWSAYLWFLRHLQSCEHQSVLKWVEENGKMLFEKFFQEPNGSGLTRFAIICLEDCVDMVKQLLQTKHVAEELKKDLNEWEKVVLMSTHEMGPEISGIISDHCNIFQIVPVNSTRSQMYGIHIPVFDPQNDQERLYLIDDEAENLVTALKNAGIEHIPLPEGPEYTSSKLQFNKLMPWLEKVLREEPPNPPCSLLFFSIACHGIHHYVADAAVLHMHLKKIFQLINEQFPTIPKVVVIQACAEHAEGLMKYTDDFNDVVKLNPEKKRMSMEDLVGTEKYNTLLMMAAAEGKSYVFSPYIGTLLNNLATCMNEAVKSREAIIIDEMLDKTLDTYNDTVDKEGNYNFEKTACLFRPKKNTVMGQSSKMKTTDSEGQDTNAEYETY